MSEGVVTQPHLALDGRAETALDDAPAIPFERHIEEPLAKAKAKPKRPKAKSDEVIEPGRALALTAFAPPATSAGEKLIRLAYRLGVSGSTLTAPFRKPMKPLLLATVDTPYTGDRVAGMALRAGHFLVHGVKAPIGQMDFTAPARLTPPFEHVVHGFEWLRDLCASAPREQCIPTAERVLAAWLEANPQPG